MNKEEELLLDFYSLMIEIAQNFCFLKVFNTGSSAEVVGNDYSVSKFAGDNLVDVDGMIISKALVVYSGTDIIPSPYRNLILRYMTQDRYPCYCCIKKIDKSPFLNSFLPAAKEQNCFVSGPSLVVNPKNEFRHLKFSIEHQRLCPEDCDLVLALHSPYFPNEAVEWISRQRPHGSTSQNITRSVVGYGYDLVFVSHKLSSVQDEWRFSFSIAELMLIKNWSVQHRIVYRVVRVLFKMSLSKGKREFHLCSYYFKTLMLWAVDTRPHRSWDNIMDSAKHILLEMIRCVQSKCLSHYFVPWNNLIDHLNTEDICHAVRSIVAIYKICCEPSMILTSNIDNLFSECADEEIRVKTFQEFVFAPECISQSLVISSKLSIVGTGTCRAAKGLEFCSQGCKSSLNCLRDTSKLQTMPFMHKIIHRSNSTDFINTLMYTEQNKKSRLESKYIVSCSCITSSNPRNAGYPGEFYEISEISQQESILLQYVAASICSKLRLSIRVSRLMYQVFDRSATLVARIKKFNDHELNNNKESERISRSILVVEPLSSINILNFVLGSDSMFSNIPVMAIYCHKPGVSPTVPISWLINKAYTANHYYTLLSDYKTTEKICDEIINTYCESFTNMHFAHNSLSILLSTRYMKIYDRDIQKLLGLSALCSFVIHESGDRSVHLPVNPAMFALYLQTRSVMDRKEFFSSEILNLRSNLSAYWEKWINSINYYGEHCLAAIIKIVLRTSLNQDLKPFMNRKIAEFNFSQTKPEVHASLSKFVQSFDSFKIGSYADMMSSALTWLSEGANFFRVVLADPALANKVMPAELANGNQTTISEFALRNLADFDSQASFIKKIGASFLDPINAGVARYTEHHRAVLSRQPSLD